MRFLRSVLLASSCLLSSVSAADSAAAPDDDDGSGAATATSSRVREVYTMGFEAETSVLKVPSSQPSRLLKSLMCAWEFTLDTPDNSIATLPSEDPNTQATPVLEGEAKSEEEDAIDSEPLLNTEAKTIGGLNHENINHAVKELMQLWKDLEKYCEGQTTIVEIRIADMLPSHYLIPCEESIETIRVFKATTEVHHKKRLVYPQITYCFPIARIDELLQHLSKVLDNNGSTTFSKYLFRDHPRYAISSRIIEKREPEQLDPQKAQTALQTISRLVRKNKDSLTDQSTESIRLKKEFLAKADKVLSGIIDKYPAAYGLCVLFIHYAYSLFMDDYPIKWEEPGPKPELGLMSRLSFSEIYDSFIRLPRGEEEQGAFKLFVTSLEPKFLDQRIRQYKTCAITQLRDENRITVKNWYDSIVTPEMRIKGRDRLSPPPECGSIPPYAMGLLNMDHLPPAHIILEVRAYSRVKVRGVETTLDNFDGLINTEAEWFFKQLSNEGDAI